MHKVCNSCSVVDMIDLGTNCKGIANVGTLILTDDGDLTGIRTANAGTLVLTRMKGKYRIPHTRAYEETEEINYVFNPRYRICPRCGLIEQYVEREELKKIIEFLDIDI